MKFLNELIIELEKAGIEEDVKPMEKYMKNHFEFYGVRSPKRKEVFRKVWKEQGIPAKDFYTPLILNMMNHPKREMNYCAIDLAIRCQKRYSNVKDIDWIQSIICTHSWWDTVDSIAPNILGKYFLDFPQKRNETLDRFLDTDDMWLHRSCILFQLKYKENTDQELLFELCRQFSTSKEFFIQKAIGWALRQYAYTNAPAVYKFVDNTSLAKLSTREANKHRKS